MTVKQAILWITCALIFAALHTFVSLEYDGLKFISPKTLHQEKGYSKLKAWVVFFAILIFTPFIIPGKLTTLWFEKIIEANERREQLKELSPEDEKFIKELMLEMEELEGKRKK